MSSALVIGSRGSRLALTQTHQMADALRDVVPTIEIHIEIVTTTGDRFVDRPLVAVGGKGLFTKELETALLAKHIDLAVHSMKDLPTELPEGLTVGAVPRRASPFDAFIARGKAGFDALEPGARVGTSSLRRRAQLLAHRPDIAVVDLRGNVDTRLRRVHEGAIDAAVLACAGLERLGRADTITEVLSPEVMVPAPAQGALAVEIRADDTELLEILSAIQDSNAAAEVAAERALLAALGGGCRVPIGALARVEGRALTLHAVVCNPDGTTILRTSARGAVTAPEDLGKRAADALMKQGACDVIAAVIGSIHGEHA